MVPFFGNMSKNFEHELKNELGVVGSYHFSSFVIAMWAWLLINQFPNNIALK